MLDDLQDPDVLLAAGVAVLVAIYSRRIWRVAAWRARKRPNGRGDEGNPYRPPGES